jgi:cytochrome P450
VGGTSGVLTRTALADVVVLGHVVPKGTRLVLCGHGGGIMEPVFDIDEKLRSETYRKAEGGGKRTVGDWAPEGIKTFDPERWLVVDQKTGEKVFDAQAGPHIMFGAGPRGCFGKKLAYLELRIAFVLVLWSFRLLDVPERYGDWEAMDQLTHSPVRCYVRLEKV